MEKLPYQTVWQNPAKLQGVTAEDVLILPIPITRDGVHLSDNGNEKEPCSLESLASALPPASLLVGYGEKPPIFANHPYADLTKDFSFVCGNAELTAEGGMALLLEGVRATGGFSLSESLCVILGYGRIARGMAKRLDAFGANILIGARKKEARHEAEVAGYRTYDIEDASFFENRGKYLFSKLPHILINTVPASSPILGAKNMPMLTLSLELSGTAVARDACRELGCPLLDGRAMPLRYTPRAAGALLSKAIVRIIKEQYHPFT